MTLPYYLDPKPDPGILMSDKYVVFDFETTSIEKGSALNEDNRLLMAAWYTSWDDRFHYKWADEYSQAELVRDLRNADVIVAHNLAFELHWLNRMGMPYGERMGYDTMLGDYVIAGNRKMPFNLESCCARHGVKGKASVVASVMKCGIMPEDTPSDWVIEYGIEDVRATRDLFLKQRAALNKCGLMPTMFTRCILTPVLAAIGSRGVQLDCAKVQEAHQEASDRLAEIEEELSDIAGDINLNSPIQLAELIYDRLKFKELRRHGKPDRTASGGRRTDMATIGNLKATNKKQRKFQSLLIEKSKAASALSKNLTYFKALCEQKDGVLYGEFLQHRTATHRLSSVGRKTALKVDGEDKEIACQLMNLPRQYKTLFTGRGDTYTVEADYSQLEFRVAGILGKDENIKKDVLNGVDVHTNAMEVLNKAGLDCDRTGAKQHSFRPLFSWVKEKKKPTPEDNYSKWFKERYSGIADEQMRWAHTALRDKKIKSATGMWFYYPECRMTESGYINGVNQIFNHQIQSLAGAEATPVALVYLYWLTKDIEGIDIVLTVHDSIISEVSQELLPEYCRTVSNCMLDRTYDYLRDVYGIEMYCPLGIGMSAGTHWSEDSLTAKDKSLIVKELLDSGYERAVVDGGEIKIDYHKSSDMT